jgi:putative Holliday junction resolvase
MTSIDTVIVMGFDFGTTKIGIAVGQTVTRTATALTTVKARQGKPDWSVIDQLVAEWKPASFVVGLPLNMDDSESEMSAAAEKFARRLNGRYQLETIMMDERLSTFEARGNNVGDIDAEAARVILESYLQQP